MLTSGQEMPCLVHSKLRSAGFLEVTVRTGNPAFSSQLSQYLLDILH